MWRRTALYLLVGLLLLLPSSAVMAQRTLYLDASLGQWYGHAEEAYLRRKHLPYPVRSNVFNGSFWGGLQARLVLNPRWSATAGVALGDRVAWTYHLTVPPEATNNPYVGESEKRRYSTFSIGLPLGMQRTLWRANTAAMGPQGQLHAWGIGLALLGGITPSYRSGPLQSFNFQLPGLYDTISFRQSAYSRGRLGLTLDVGAVVRLYRLDRERLNLTLQVHQGLLEMVRVPFDYAYNRRTSRGQLHVYGSGISLSVGYPIRLKTGAPRSVLAP